MSERSHRFSLPLLQAGQAQKEIAHNEALVHIDHLLHLVVQAEPSDTPPIAPAEATSWLIGNAPVGDWVGQGGGVALWTDGGWRFLPSRDGMIAWMADGALFLHRGGNWASTWPVAAVEIGGVQVVGEQQPPIAEPAGGGTMDAEARGAIGAILLTLRSHGLISGS